MAELGLLRMRADVWTAGTYLDMWSVWDRGRGTSLSYDATKPVDRSANRDGEV